MKPDAQVCSRGQPLVSTETRPGFTLIELLVVIAIIAVLAGMILVVLGKAKNSASKATDINNLRQIMIAVQVYASDNAGALPFPNWDNGAAGSPQGWLYKVDAGASGTNRFEARTGALWRALRNPKAYFCPMDTTPNATHYSESMGTDMQRRQQISSYAMNGAVIGYGLINTPVKLAQLRATDCAFWETDETDPWYFNDGANWPGEGVSARHNQGGIEALFGGSVDYVDLRDWYKDVDYDGKNRLWCYPGREDGGGPTGHSQ
jgi:prepilin-type N-terminal cleavage/methylation domain-containing protein